MPIDEIRKKLYLFIREMNEEHRRVYLYHFKKFAALHDYKHQDVTYALQQLKQKGAVSYSDKYGWYTRSL